MTAHRFFETVKRALAAQQFCKSYAAFTLATLVFSAMLGGCSVRPIQQDVTRIPTKGIVDHIRCEIKFAVLDKAITKLRQRADDIAQSWPASSPPPAEEARIVETFTSIAKNLTAQRDAILNGDALHTQNGERIIFDPQSLLTPRAIKFYNHFINSGIAYDFTFDILETNNSGLTIDPVRLITNGTVGATVGAGVGLIRANTRRFQLTDTFRGLLENNDLNCGQQPNRSDNLGYPVAGQLGLDELIGTFVDIAEVQLLKANKVLDGSVFGDTMKFTTALSGGVTPHVQIAVLGNRLGLASPATLTLNASRMDTHMLAISLSMGAEGDVPLREPRSRQRRASTAFLPPPNPWAAENINRALVGLKEQRDRNLQDNLTTILGR
jgi:hypothetical protein